MTLDPIFYYLTKDHKIKTTTDITKWGKAMQSKNRIVKQKTINN